MLSPVPRTLRPFWSGFPPQICSQDKSYGRNGCSLRVWCDLCGFWRNISCLGKDSWIFQRFERISRILRSVLQSLTDVREIFEFFNVSRLLRLFFVNLWRFLKRLQESLKFLLSQSLLPRSFERSTLCNLCRLLARIFQEFDGLLSKPCERVCVSWSEDPWGSTLWGSSCSPDCVKRLTAVALIPW